MKKRNIPLTILYEFKLAISQVILWLWIKLGLLKSLLIVPFEGFGNDKEILLVGRVIRDNRIGESNPEDSVWRNIGRMRRRFMSVVIPGVQVKAEFQGEEYFVRTDEEGYFEFKIHPKKHIQIPARWQQINLTLVDQVIKNQGEVKATADIFLPEGDIDYGIVSDIDDTIIPTGAMRMTEMLKTTFAKNAHTRVPFPGVAAFYKALQKGRDGIESNPFFYVSSSPWNLYDFLHELLRIHHIPKGPLMLRDIGLSRTELISGSHAEHKLEQIRQILSVNSQLPFILIGDSGQEDPTIYLQVVCEFPGRIIMIFIRDVHTSRHAYAEKISEKLKELGVAMLLVKDTLEASRYALDKGWILEEDMEEIVEGKVKNEEENEEV
ncbi:phosphatase domain-containing protein [Algoriphagus sp. C2-6-M1]|uniref:App1 family protein n=1 Tax=Algoriphagus persicinus TaxID=3108754 RepID=UPI002B3FAE6A|nr:phosphatase domain-containing protein [Algoriphagus sp. C2-6-M1]MEB2780961.1 phosphatase domain-containing protein [Algoriphagus sp. C2-6-M1]